VLGVTRWQCDLLACVCWQLHVNIIPCILGHGAPCRLWGCKNRPAPFPGWMSWMTAKPGSDCLSVLSRNIVLLFIMVAFVWTLVCVCMCSVSLVVLVKLSVRAERLARKSPLRKPIYCSSFTTKVLIWMIHEWPTFSLSLSLSLSLRFSDHWTWVSLCLLKQRMMEAVVTTGLLVTGAISRAKLQSNHHHQQTKIQFFTGRMPFLSPNHQCQSTEGKGWPYPM